MDFIGYYSQSTNGYSYEEMSQMPQGESSELQILPLLWSRAARSHLRRFND
jgi:hypothetical protein